MAQSEGRRGALGLSPWGFMPAEGISAFLSLVNPICSQGPAPAGHLSIFFHPTWAELTV